MTGVTALLPHIKSGRLRALAVSSPQRLASPPDVPTVAESGYPGFQADRCYGIVAPAGTPAARVQKLNAELNRTLQDPAVGRGDQGCASAGRLALVSANARCLEKKAFASGQALS